MAKAGSINGKGQGWHKQSIRHSNARKHGKAGGKYATSISITHHEPTTKMPRYKSTQLYKFDELSKEAKEKAINEHRDFNVDHDWWDMDGLFDPTSKQLKNKEFKKEYDEATKNGYTTLNDFKIESFDIDRGDYLQIKQIDTKDQYLFLKQIGLTKKEINEIDYLEVENERERDSKLRVYLKTEIGSPEYERVEDKAQEGFSNLIHEAKKRLRENYEYYTSDESVAESLKSNEYDFNSNGGME